MIYLNQVEENKISSKNVLTPFELSFLGVDPDKMYRKNTKKNKSFWNKEQSFLFSLEEKQISGIESIIFNYKKAVKDIEHLRGTIFKFFQKS